MGKYSGKCDWFDTVELHGMDNILKSKIYLGWNPVPLRIDSEKELVPYYPHLVRLAASENGIGIFRLTDESYVDRDERERLKWYLEDATKYVNQCKRKKKEVDLDYYNSKPYEFNKEVKTKILERVANKDTDISDIHLPVYERYRQELYKEMLRVGWTEKEAKIWCFGFRGLNPDFKIED